MRPCDQQGVVGGPDVRVGNDQIRIPEGTVAAIRVTPVARGRKEYEAFHRALEQAELATTIDSERGWLDKAYRRDLAMQISFGLGAALLVGGAGLALGGAIARGTLRRRMESPHARLRVGPASAGSGVALHF
jgi:hypothetical protein